MFGISLVFWGAFASLLWDFTGQFVGIWPLHGSEHSIGRENGNGWHLNKRISGWWFRTVFVFPYIGNNHPNWIIFFRGVETTNSWFTHWKWWFSIVMLVYQRVTPGPPFNCQPTVDQQSIAAGWLICNWWTFKAGQCPGIPKDIHVA